MCYKPNMKPEELRQLWDELRTPRIEELVDTDTNAALGRFHQTDLPYHCLYYDLDSASSSPDALAQFVRAGLPDHLPIDADTDWILHCNWPKGEQQGGRAVVYRTARDHLGVPVEELADLLGLGRPEAVEWAASRLREAIEDCDFYLPEALMGEDAPEYYHPLNSDTAARVLRRDQEKFRRVVDALLVDTSAESRGRAFADGRAHRGSGPWFEALQDLEGVANRAVPLCHQAQFDSHGRAWFVPVRNFEIQLAYLPNSVTWAWVRLFDEVQRGAEYARCQNPACSGLFERTQPREKYCNRNCASRHRQQRYRERKSRQAVE